MLTNRYFHLCLFSLTSAFNASFAYADNKAVDKDNVHASAKSFSYVISVAAGPVWARGGEQQQFYLQPEIEELYTANRPNTRFISGELFLGLQKDLNAVFQGQLGVAFVSTGDANLSGNIWDDADPRFNNYTYSYKLSHQHIALKGKLLAAIGHRLHPYISGSIGSGRNKSHAYTNTPTIFEAVTKPNFENNTTSDFTYTLGAGIQVDCIEHIQQGLVMSFPHGAKAI